MEFYNDDELYTRYRFDRRNISFIFGLIRNNITHSNKRSLALPPLLQLLICLRFLGCGSFFTLGKPIMMFRVNLINYLVKLHLKCINEYCIRISEILCILKCVVMIDMKTRHIFFGEKPKNLYFIVFSLILAKSMNSKWIVNDTH